MSQCAYIFKVNCCLKVHNAHENYYHQLRYKNFIFKSHLGLPVMIWTNVNYIHFYSFVRLTILLKGILV